MSYRNWILFFRMAGEPLRSAISVTGPLPRRRMCSTDLSCSAMESKWIWKRSLGTATSRLFVAPLFLTCRQPDIQQTSSLCSFLDEWPWITWPYTAWIWLVVVWLTFLMFFLMFFKQHHAITGMFFNSYFLTHQSIRHLEVFQGLQQKGCQVPELLKPCLGKTELFFFCWFFVGFLLVLRCFTHHSKKESKTFFRDDLSGMATDLHQKQTSNGKLQTNQWKCHFLGRQTCKATFGASGVTECRQKHFKSHRNLEIPHRNTYKYKKSCLFDLWVWRIYNKTIIPAESAEILLLYIDCLIPLEPNLNSSVRLQSSLRQDAFCVSPTVFYLRNFVRS